MLFSTLTSSRPRRGLHRRRRGGRPLRRRDPQHARGGPRRAAVAGRRRSTRSLPNFRNFDFKDRVAYGDAGAAADVLAWVTRLRRSSTSASCSALGLAVLPLAGLPVSCGSRSSLLAAGAARAAGARPGSTGGSGRFRRAGGGPLPVVGRAREAPGPRLRERWPPTSTGSAPCSTSAASGSSRGTSASSCCARSIDITTTLDPRLEIAYRYGAIFLSEPPPLGAGRPREGIEVLETGRAEPPRLVAAAPGPRLLPLPLPRRRASAPPRVLDEAARICRARRSGCARWRPTSWRRAASATDARRMWQQMYEQAEAGIIKENARLRLQILDSLDAATASPRPWPSSSGAAGAARPGSRSCARPGCGAGR